MMTNKYSIYIPSRARYSDKLALTAHALKNNHVDFKLVIEPQDEFNYCQNFDANYILVMKENDMGIAYVRNWIKQYSIAHNEDYHWQMDDNIKKFQMRTNNKNINCHPLDCVIPVENYVDNYKNIGLAGLKHAVFAFAAKDDIAFNNQVYSAFLANNKLERPFGKSRRIDINWRDGLIEDTDYSLQVLYHDYCTVLFNRLIIAKTTTMAMPGGNTEISHSGGNREKRSLGLQKAYPGIFETIYRNNQMRIKPSRIWQTFKQRPIKK